MGEQNDNLDKQVKEIYEKVNCAYLMLSDGLIIYVTKFKLEHAYNDLLVECHNPRCGPKHLCDFLDDGKCDYRSAEVKPEDLQRN